MLTNLLEWNADTSTTTHQDPSRQDADGNTLFHLVIKEKDNKFVKEAAKLLSKYKVNPYLANNKGEVPLKIIEKTNSCYKYLSKAAKHYPEPEKCQPVPEKEDTLTTDQPHQAQQVVEDAKNGKDIHKDQDSACVVRMESPVKPKVIIPKKTLSKEQMKREIKEMITNMTPKRLRLDVIKREELRRAEEPVSMVPVENNMKFEESNGMIIFIDVIIFQR